MNFQWKNSIYTHESTGTFVRIFLSTRICNFSSILKSESSCFFFVKCFRSSPSNLLRVTSYFTVRSKLQLTVCPFFEKNKYNLETMNTIIIFSDKFIEYLSRNKMNSHLPRSNLNNKFELKKTAFKYSRELIYLSQIMFLKLIIIVNFFSM